jgi:hypothetical protein
MYSLDAIQRSLRCVADGMNCTEAAEASETTAPMVRKWSKQYKVNQNSFLSDDEIIERLSLFANSKRKKQLEKAPDFSNHPINQPPKEKTPVICPDDEDDDDDEPAQLPAEPPKEVVKAPPLKSSLSTADQARLSQSIRLALGDKAMNDVNNAVVALITATAERLKLVDNAEDAVKMVSSAIGLKQLLDVLDAPPMAMNWNDVSKIISIIREANEIQLLKPEKEDNAPPTSTRVNVMILSQKPLKATKTIDAELCDD